MAWFFGNKQQKYIENLEKNNKKRQEKEREEAEIITIGKATPEQQEERASQVVAQRNQKRMEAIEEEQEKEDKAQEDQLFVINGAKVKFGPHIGTFKVLSDTPTIQSKTVGTQIENAPLNFTFEDGFQLLTLTQWQDMGDAKFQGNVALIKKSTIVSTGKMSPANAPIESGKIEFIDSGQINIPENIDTTGMPLLANNNPPCIKEVNFFTSDGKEILKNGKTHNLCYGEPFYIEVITENIPDDTPMTITLKDTKISFEGQLKENKIKTTLLSIPISCYDESKENYIYEKYITEVKQYQEFEFEFKIGENESKISADNNIIIPYTYRRNYEELVGLFATSNNKNNDIKKNYENDFINNKEFQIKNIVENFTNYLENSNLTIEDIKKQVEKEAKNLWKAAIAGVQKDKLDDRPLYWARNKMQVALKRYYLFKNDIDFEKSIVKKNSNLEEIIITFEEKSRNYTGIDFSKAPKGTKKILITGFDPFILNEFNNKEIEEYSPNIKQSNPSGVVALALNGNTELGGYIQTMIVPVRYTDFDSSQDRKNGQGEGIIEKYIKPFIEKKGEVDMIITISQADAEYNIDVFATATRGGFNDNMNFIREDGSKAIPGGAETIKTTLPKKMVDSKLGTNYNGRYFITKKDFDDYYKGDYSKDFFLDINDDLPQLSIYYGPGGNYLSNEIFYRVAKLRESLQPKLPTGHFHIRKIQGVKEELVPEKVKELITIIKETIKNALQH
ncbi:hypothetical protein [Capnocytophaga endodontalis]|uniref:Uncharacterized protein n=1 Tax=Capnocytophaga endodontalis TaxID=2708117 RepID=A0A1Z4BQA2_9FLAO|nr:hypothetical protein [Capnocytophaga endodontalis]ASF43484.1 hypothetical protein CBG49_10595 [Capnocytophaga endodontalis]